MQDSRAKSRKDPQKSKKTSLPTDSCLNNSVRAHTHRLVLKRRLFSRHRALMGSRSSRQVWRQSVFTKFRGASCLCFAPCPCFASCNCWYDPFIVRKLVHRSLVSLSFAHPSRRARSTLTTVCFCAHAFSGSLCSHRVCNPVTRSIISSSP